MLFRSITRSVCSYIQNKQYTKEDLFYQNECWNSWEHHSRFSHPDADTCLKRINASQHKAHAFLKEADWLLITLGSAFVYELPSTQGEGLGVRSVVANCHKVPTDKFNKRLLPVEEVVSGLQTMIDELRVFNPGLKIIFTISPVRHLRDGFVENNRSKATLIHAVHHLTEANDHGFYFPAYELIIDVERLNIDAASCRQMEEAARAAGEEPHAGVARLIRETIDKRGKMHNPVTGSGGMLLGRVHSVGERLPEPHRGLRPRQEHRDQGDRMSGPHVREQRARARHRHVVRVRGQVVDRSRSFSHHQAAL